MCPVSMTYSAIPALRVDPELAAEWEPRLTLPDYERGALCGMAMTEKQGGSDVRAGTTRAEPAGDGAYELTGHKWFCSHPMGAVFLVLAQAPGGLSCFVVERGPGFELQRLKDKLGTRSLASSEVEFRGAPARLLGEEGRGVATIIEMVTHTRLDCVIGSAAGMRRGVAEAVHHARHRSAFGALLAEQPLMVNVLADLTVESEAATASALRLARAYDEDDRAFRRFGTAVMKYWICKRATMHAAEALECLGGNGYVEESPMPQLLRDAPLNGIWEGSGNVISLDVLRALAREPEGLPAFLAECERGRGADARLDAHLDALPAALTPLAGDDAQWSARRAVEALALAFQGSLLVRARRRRPWPTRSAPAGSATRAGACSGRSRPAWTGRRSSRGRSRSDAPDSLSPRMTVRDLLGDGPAVDVTALAYDNRAVRPGSLFFCVPGFTRDGHDFAPDAVARGAVALVVTRPLGLGVPEVEVADVRAAMARAAARFHGDPTATLPVVGITGTSGKTTTTHLVRHLLESAGRPCGLLGGVTSVVGGEERPAVRTTPEAIDLQATFRSMLDAGDAACAMEVSSHALELRRVDGVRFAVAAFTNLSQDHLDFHPDMETYFAAKERLFLEFDVGVPVVGVDDAWGRRLAASVPGAVTRLDRRAPRTGRAADLRARLDGTSFTVRSPAGTADVELPLRGRFNAANALVAMACCAPLGLPLDAMAAALASARPVPGRVQAVDEGQDFAVLVDYAHKPGALEKVLASARDVAVRARRSSSSGQAATATRRNVPSWARSRHGWRTR